MKKRIFLTVLLSCLFLVMTGCGKKNDPELASYKRNMTDFYDRLADYDKKINSIDPESDSATDELLGYLDEMNKVYDIMSRIEIPDQFNGISDIAVEAAEYMQKANEFYHLAYDDEFDADSEMLAAQYYQRANSRVLVMLEVLHGEVPEGDGISVETKSSYEFSVIESENAESNED